MGVLLMAKLVMIMSRKKAMRFKRHLEKEHWSTRGRIAVWGRK